MPSAPLGLNLLLNGMSAKTRAELASEGRVREIEVSETIYEPGELWDLFFPLDAVISVIHQLEDGSAVEVAMMGPEGFAGTNAFLGVPQNPHLGTCQGRGFVLQIHSAAARDIVSRDEDAARLLMRSIHFFSVQISQLAACNRLHNTVQRLAHWLLLLQDRVGTRELSLTHDFLARMLATRRPGITVAMQALREQQAIEQKRNSVRVADRTALERASCECYAAIVASYEQMFGMKPRAHARVTPQM